MAVFGTILTNALNAGLGAVMPGLDVGKLLALSFTAGAGAAPALSGDVRAIIADAITHTFSVSLWVVAAALVVTLLIPKITLRDGKTDDPSSAGTHPVGA